MEIQRYTGAYICIDIDVLKVFPYEIWTVKFPDRIIRLNKNELSELILIGQAALLHWKGEL